VVVFLRGGEERGDPHYRRCRLGKLVVQRVSRECFPILCNGFSFAVGGLGGGCEQEEVRFLKL